VLGVAWRVTCEHDGGPPSPDRGSARDRGAAPDRGAAGASASASAGRNSASTPPARRAPSRPGAAEPPLPPEPPPDEEAEMLAEAASEGPDPAGRRDPEEVAMELLSAQLGARAMDERR
jgi:DNA polymerase-3 subunit gamma/tau